MSAEPELLPEARVPEDRPMAYYFELATGISYANPDAPTYERFEARLNFYYPTVPPESVRNIIPLYRRASPPVQPATVQGGAELDARALEAAQSALNKWLVEIDGDAYSTLGASEVAIAITAYLSALPAPADRAAVLEEAAQHIERFIIEEQPGDVKTVLAKKMAKSLRNLASRPEPMKTEGL